MNPILENGIWIYAVIAAMVGFFTVSLADTTEISFPEVVALVFLWPLFLMFAIAKGCILLTVKIFS